MLAQIGHAIIEDGLRSRPGTLPGDTGSIVLPDGSVDRITSGQMPKLHQQPSRFGRKTGRALGPEMRVRTGPALVADGIAHYHKSRNQAIGRLVDRDKAEVAGCS